MILITETKENSLDELIKSKNYSPLHGALTSKHFQKWDNYQLGTLSNKQLQAIDPQELVGLRPTIPKNLLELNLLMLK